MKFLLINNSKFCFSEKVLSGGAEAAAQAAEKKCDRKTFKMQKLCSYRAYSEQDGYFWENK